MEDSFVYSETIHDLPVRPSDFFKHLRNAHLKILTECLWKKATFLKYVVTKDGQILRRWIQSHIFSGHKPNWHLDSMPSCKSISYYGIFAIFCVENYMKPPHHSDRKVNNWGPGKTYVAFIHKRLKWTVGTMAFEDERVRLRNHRQMEQSKTKLTPLSDLIR